MCTIIVHIPACDNNVACCLYAHLDHICKPGSVEFRRVFFYEALCECHL